MICTLGMWSHNSTVKKCRNFAGERIESCRTNVEGWRSHPCNLMEEEIFSKQPHNQSSAKTNKCLYLSFGREEWGAKMPPTPMIDILKKKPTASGGWSEITHHMSSVRLLVCRWGIPLVAWFLAIFLAIWNYYFTELFTNLRIMLRIFLKIDRRIF